MLSRVVNRSRESAHRCCEEAVELKHAIATRDKALILDEIVDVLYFVRQIGLEYGITVSMVQKYAARKSNIRQTSGRDKALEIALARLITGGNFAP